MPYILVEDFKAGLDTRRTNVTSVPGSLATLTNAHLTRGGEIEKRKAFVQLVTLPTDSDGNPATVGLAAGGGQIFVFGHLPSASVTFPTGTPSNVNYVQLRHPECEASFDVTAGSSSDNVTNITVNSLEILNSTIAVQTSGSPADPDYPKTAEAIAEQINAHLSYGATAVISVDTVVSGTSHTDGTYTNVLLSGGTGTLAKATVVVAGNAISEITITDGGSGYVVGDSLGIPTGTIGGSGTPSCVVRNIGTDQEYTATSDGAKVIIRGAIAESTAMVITKSAGFTVANQTTFKSIALTELLGSEFFDGYVYTAARFADGKIYHYWEGQNNSSVTPPNRIADWFDGRARAKFRITGGTAGGTAATGTITITAGTDNPGDNVRVIRVNGVQVNDSAVAHTGDNTTTATAVKDAINATTSVPNYSATSSGAVVTITASAVGTLYNGYVIEVENDGAVTTSQANLSGGLSNSISNITVDGEQIIENEVPWSTSNTHTATLVAKAINEYASAPEYEASTDGSIINIISKEGGIAYNSKVVAITKAGDVTFDQYGMTTLDGGADASTLAGYSPGGYVLTVKSKMHSVSDSLWHFSAIDKPWEWNATASPDFAGFVNLSNNARGSEDLKAVANYYSNLAIFAEQAVQIWFVDPNPNNLQQIQVLHNTGTIAANSVVEFGDSDVFYLDSSGIRSLKARDSSNAAFVEDIGNPIDSLIQEEIQTNLDASRKAVGILSPKDGRYLLAIGTKVYVFSYYPSSKISAWSVYEPGFTIQHWAYDGDQMLCRGDDNKLYSLGGSNNTTYDNSTVTVQLPFLDGGKPATSKDFYGLDAVVENDWDVYVSTDPTNISSNEQIGTIDRTTYGLGRVTMTGYSTHLAVKMVCSKSGSAKIGNLAVHYEQAEAG